MSGMAIFMGHHARYCLVLVYLGIQLGLDRLDRFPGAFGLPWSAVPRLQYI